MSLEGLEVPAVPAPQNGGYLGAVAVAFTVSPSWLGIALKGDVEIVSQSTCFRGGLVLDIKA